MERGEAAKKEALAMAGQFVPLVLLPRYTTLSGNFAFTTVGMDVSDYEKAVLSFWRSAGSGGPAPTITYEESTDQNNWTTCGGGPFADPGANLEGQHSPTLTKRWFRISVTIAANSVMTCWAIGYLQLREA